LRISYLLPAKKSLIWGMRSGPSRYYNLIIVEPDALSEIPLPRERPGFSLDCGRVLVCLGRLDAAFRPQLLRIHLLKLSKKG